MKFSTGGKAALDFADESANKQRCDGHDDGCAKCLPSTVRFRDRRYSPDERRNLFYMRILPRIYDFADLRLA